MNGTTAYALSKKYVEDTSISLGAVKGAPCTIKSTTKIGGDSIVTFEWTGTSGTKQTSSITVSDGVSITSIDIDSDNNLVCTMSDGTEQKAKINILDNVYTKSETDTLLLDKAEKNHNHDSAYASKDTEHEHSNKETLDKFGVNDGGKLTFNGDVVTPEAMNLSDYLKKTDAQNTYVKKETGKGLSENDFTTVLKDAYDKAVENSHTHSNKSIIDKFSEDSDGKLLYDGQSIEADLSTVYKKTETYSQTESDDKFVAKESGKGLSANDLTNDLKSSYDDAVTAKHTHENGTVLDGITAEKVEAWDKAEENVQSDWNETDDTADGFIKNKPTIPDAYDDTALSNRVKSIEDEVPNLATKTYVGEQITNAEHLKREIVTVLPSDTEASDNIIYMLKVESTSGNDKYREYMKIDGTVQMVGDTSVDLTDYAKTADVNTELGKKVNTTDIVDSLVSDATDKPLSAAQGKALDGKKVDKVDGMALSSNDYTDEEKSLVATIEDKVDKSVILSIINKRPTVETLDDFLELQRNDKVYKVKVPKFASNPTTTCEKLGDNAGLNFTPSTDTVEGIDDYIDKVEFTWWHNNYVRNSNGDAIITALEGDDNYAETGAVDVGSCGMSFYYKFDETPDDHIMLTWSPSPHEELGLMPFSGNVPGHSYWCLSAYPSITASDGLLRSQPNGKIVRNQSYSDMITNYKKKGSGYYGAGAERNTFQIIFNMLMGATKNSQSLYDGVTSWNFQYEAAVQRSDNATYFPVTESQASNLEVGCYVSVGYGTNINGSINNDRGGSSIHKYADDVKILHIEDMDDGNKAVYLDVSTGFNTMPVAITDSLSAPVIMSSMHMWTGETNKVIGKHNGSAVSNSNGRHSYRVQGVEYALGAYIVASDTVMVFKSDYSKDVYVAPKGVTHSTSESTIKSTYKLIGNIPANSSGDDYWVGDVDIDEETGGWNPSVIGSSNSQGMGDTMYAGGKSTSGTREYLQGGHLRLGSAAGSAFLSCGLALSDALWVFCGCD